MKTVVSMFSVLLLTACGNLADLAVTDISTLTLSYSDFSGSLDPAEVQRIPPKGTLVRLAAGRDVEYAIAPQTDGITVNPYGVVLVDSDAPVNPTEYTVTATGAGAYANTQTATVTIEVVVPSGPALDGKVTYDPIGTVFGTQAVGNVPYDSSLTGSDGSVLPLLRYTASDGSNELAPGITIAEDTGIVTVAGTADARTETHYTVMVSADGYQPVMLNGAVSITVDQLALAKFEYVSIVTGVENTLITSLPPTIEPAGAIVKYSLSSGTQLPAGLDIDEDTGAIYGQTSSPELLDTYSVTAAAADKNYTGSLTADVQVIVYSSTTPTIVGTLTYSPISTTYGQVPISAGIQSSTLASSRGPTNPLSNIQYTAINGKGELATGVTIDANSGEITVDSIAANAMTTSEYDVRITADNHQAATIPNAVSVTVNQQDLTAISVFVQNPSSSETVTALTNDTTHSIASLLSVSYTVGTDYTLSIAPVQSTQNTTGAITIAPDTGVISIDSGVTVADAGSYTITATGINNYINPSSTTATFTLTVDPKSFIAASVFVQNPSSSKTVTALTNDTTHSIASLLSVSYTVGTDYTLSIAPVQSTQNTTGAITIDSATGEISIDQGVTVADAGDYTITATGINNYKNASSTTATFTLTVSKKNFNNAPIFDTNSLRATVDSQTAASHSILLTGSGYTFGTDYELSITAPGAITIDSATGKISIGSGVTVNDTGTYTVTATGEGNYSGVSTASFSLKVVIPLSTVAGFQLSVTDRTFTSSTTGHYADVTAGGLTAGTDYRLRIEPATDASIDNAGLISLTRPRGGAFYTVIAEGIGNYRGEIRDSFTLRESLSSAGFKLSMKDYTVFSSLASSVKADITDTTNGDYALSLVDSGGNGNPAGMSIDASGKISIPGSIDANDSGEYTVIAAGTGDYGGTVKAAFNLTVSDSNFIYDDIFVTAAVAANGGTSWQTFNAPPVNVTPRWKNSSPTPAGTTFSVPSPSNMPSWLTLDPLSGELTGTPDAIGFGSFVIEASLSGAAETTTVNWFVGVQPTNKDELKTAVQVELERYDNMTPPVTEYQDLRAIDTSLMTDMSDLFYVNSSNQPQYALDFNGDISSWDVSNVEDMSRMFYSDGSPMAFTGVFESSGSIHSISEWDVSRVTNMKEMFYRADNFGELKNSQYDILAEWDVSNVENMAGMFKDNDTFNQDLSKWNVSSVTDMAGMFHFAINFDQDISKWNVSNVKDMKEMFSSADNFNQDISKWNVSSVTTMEAMFLSADAFNQDISEWDVGRVTDMAGMFNSATSFNQDLNAWNVDSSVRQTVMFHNSGVAQNPPHWFSP